MIRLIEARNFRSLRHISRELGEFHVLVGANATGKSTFFDVIKLLADIVDKGIDEAISERVSHFEELTFAGKGGDIELAIEVDLPIWLIEILNGDAYCAVRYELQLGIDRDEVIIKAERVILLKKRPPEVNKPIETRSLFPIYSASTRSILMGGKDDRIGQVVVSKNPNGNDNFYFEVSQNNGKRSGWNPSFKLGNKKSALANLPDDESKFPASIWLKSFLQKGVQAVVLNSLLMRKPSPPGRKNYFKADGSNLPFVIESLKQLNGRFSDWLDHVRTALPDIKDVTTIEREEDKHRYLKITYRGDIETPSWLVSDGTLRLLALTLPAYLDSISGVYLIEEPENGIHPKAIECAYQSLSSVYSAQVLLASHSPAVLSLIEIEDLLCFSKTTSGETDIVRGREHPRLKDWKNNPNLSLVFGSGILS